MANTARRFTQGKVYYATEGNALSKEYPCLMPHATGTFFSVDCSPCTESGECHGDWGHYYADQIGASVD